MTSGTPFATQSGLRAAAYIRVSSEEQVDGHSLDAQRRAITAACVGRGWTIVEWYADEGVSAHTDDVTRRPAFHRLVQDAERRQQVQGRLERLKELYAWGDLQREDYQAQRDALEQELARLKPVEATDDRLNAFARYVASLPAAWADADQVQRNQLV
jgi:hypothetical protein